MLKFFLECFKKTKPAFRIARNTAFILALLIPGGTTLYNDFSKEPISGAIMSALMWQIPLFLLAFLFIIQFIMSPYWLYKELEEKHKGEIRELSEKYEGEIRELREAKRSELYAYVPEANIDRIFRIFFNLYKEGKFLQERNPGGMQKWDEEVIKTLMDYCGDYKNNYLINTRRAWGRHDPLQP
jgi:hypothetical protein